MNKLFENILKIILILMAFLATHYYPELWTEFAIAIPAAFLVEFFYKNSAKYTSLQSLHNAKKKYHEYMRKKKIKNAIDKEKFEEYQKKLIENAIIKALSKDNYSRKTGLEQLSQFGTEDTIDQLLEMLKNGKDKSCEKDIIKTICTIFRAHL